MHKSIYQSSAQGALARSRSLTVLWSGRDPTRLMRHESLQASA